MADFEYGFHSDTPDEESSIYSDGLPQHSQKEIHEWMEVNRKLRKNGLQSVRVLSSHDIPVHSGRYVCFDLESSHSLRSSIITLINESDRKEKKMQDLLKKNSELQKETEQLVEELELANTKAKDVKVMLECSRARVQNLEEEKSRSTSQYADEDERLRNTKSSIANKCRTLEAKVMEQEKELDRLRREVYIFAQEGESRKKRQKQVFLDFKKRAPRSQSAVDQKLLDIIDSYESQIYSLQKQLDAFRDTDKSFTVDRAYATQPSSNFKGMIRSYERQIKEKDKKIKELEEEKDIFKLDVGLRPELTDYRLQTQRVKKLEQLLHRHNISIPGEKSNKDPFIQRKKFSTRLEDLDFLPLEQCQYYLKNVCKECGTDNLDCLTDVIQELKDERNSGGRFHQYCKEFANIVESLNDKNHRGRSYSYDKKVSLILSDSNMKYYLEVVDNWKKDIAGLGDLQDAINRLLDKVVPWVKAHMEGDHSVDEMVELVERVIHAEKSEMRPQTLMEEVSRSTLESIVSHFQTLFDVPKISGVFPRMNEIYRVIGESRNVLNTLKDLLGLSPDIHNSGLVDAVGRLFHAHNSTTAKQLKKLMQTDDLNGIIRRLEEHSEFFPAFQGIIHKLFDILGVDKMDEILPAVRALKLLAK
ncbi:centrosomal protein of 70 kDa-like isoform X2 [Physella acuta]|uniref:centrosomal protein of 70 kDa-like isoform X2 n=1 Tax=Physella acuta TaxID=109671 RepID=UPI0027DAEACB|nr:centrosomal protein of 70 kDa-like isoform X2 [Physella acuta]